MTAPVLFGAQMVVPFVDDFMRRHPAIRVDLMLTNRIVDLVEERCEIAFRIGTLDDSSLKARALAPYRLIACAAPSYLAAHGVPRHPRDLADHACLGGPAWLRTLGAEWIFKRAAASFRVAVGHGTPHRSVRSQIKAARDGKGIVLAGPRSVRSELEAGDLVQVLQRFEAPSMPMHLVFQPGRSQTPAVRTFITSATAEFGTAPSGPASARPPAR